METQLNWIQELVAKDGPTPEKYSKFTHWLDETLTRLEDGRYSAIDLEHIRQAFGEALSLETIQGFGLAKPHGYSGDYEMIDKLYQMHKTDDPHLRNWDEYLHAQSAPIAVRNRKNYFQSILKALEKSGCQNGPFQIFNVASGPGRDVFEYLSYSNGHLHFDCIDADKDAIDYSKALCREMLDRITFIHKNVFRYRIPKKYRLIWSGGLFDYFDDKTFKYLLKHFLKQLDDDGELIIGNFSKSNTSRAYMEIMGDWYLHYRDVDELITLAADCGIQKEDFLIDQEPLGTNLFLRIKKGSNFIHA